MATMHEHPVLQSHTGGRSRGFSHARKSVTQMDPSQFAAMNGKSSMNGAFSTGTPRAHEFRSHETHHHSTSSTDTVKAMRQDPSHPSLTLSPTFAHPTLDTSKNWERRKSAGLPTHPGLQEPAQASLKVEEMKSTHGHKTRKNSSLAQEVVASLIIPLPFVFASLAYGFGMVPRASLSKQDVKYLEGTILEGVGDGFLQHLMPLEITGGLTSLTLFLIGIQGWFSHRLGTRQAERHSLEKPEKLLPAISTNTLKKAVSRALSVALPFYATSHLGVRFAILMLIMMVSDGVSYGQTLDGAALKKWQQIVLQRRFTLTAVLLQLTCDLGGFTNHMSISSILAGYLALCCSLFFLPMPFAHMGLHYSTSAYRAPLSVDTATSMSSAQLDGPSTARDTAPFSHCSSPLVTTNADVSLTLLIAFFLSALTFLSSFLSGSSAGALIGNDLLWAVLGSCAAALSLTSINLRLLKRSKGTGFLIGSSAAAFVLVSSHDEWTTLAYQGVLLIGAFFAMRLDSDIKHSHSHSKHHHAHQHIHSDREPISRLTDALLHNLEDWPLLYNIIAEKDSRRIFYFMW